MQTRKGANEDNLRDTCAQIEKMENEITFLKDKTDNLENRSGRSNIKITNISEKSEGSDTVGYLESLIPQLLGIASKFIYFYSFIFLIEAQSCYKCIQWQHFDF